MSSANTAAGAVNFVWPVSNEFPFIVSDEFPIVITDGAIQP